VMPVEIMLFPKWFPFHLDKISYWSRTVIVPLLVLMALKPRARNPKNIRIDELFIEPPQTLGPAPKAPHSRERWYFCEAHAAEYNKNWNYFAGLSPEEAARRAAEEEQGNAGFRQSAQWKWAGPGDGSRSRDEMRALDALELDSDADFKAIKAAHRRLVKETHPDANPGDAEAAKRFKQVQAAYDVLRKAEERKNAAF